MGERRTTNLAHVTPGYPGLIKEVWGLDYPFKLDPDQIQEIDDVLMTLTDQEQRVLILRFGLDQSEPKKTKPFKQVGWELRGDREKGLSQGRIRQLMVRAGRKLRHPSRSARLSWLTTKGLYGSVNQMSSMLKEMRIELSTLTLELVALKVRLARKGFGVDHSKLLEIGDFSRSIDDLDLSIRTGNCLHGADIHTVGELVQRTEADLLKIKNFGRKCLDEVKKILMQLNMHLGMIPRLAAWIHDPDCPEI